MEAIAPHRFQQCVRTHNTKRIKCFTHWDQFLAMTFGQLAYRESLRDIVACLSVQRTKLYHLGFRSPIARSTLAEANERRDWRIYRDFAYVLVAEARKLYANDSEFTLDLKNSCYAIDSTSIDLCLSVFPWAPYMETKRNTKGAVKLHTLMDLRGSIPTFFHMTSGKVHDVRFLDLIVFEAGAYYVMDKGYHDTARFFAITQAGAFFVTRAKSNTAFTRLSSRAVPTTGGLRSDQMIRFSSKETQKQYPDMLRRISYYDAKTLRRYVFLTNNCAVSAQTIADLYQHRWQIELFFKWVKQHLKIKTFWGHSKNAVQTQIAIALCAYLMVAILKKRLGSTRNLYEILQILSVSLLDKTPLVELFSEDQQYESNNLPQETLPFLGV